MNLIKKEKLSILSILWDFLKTLWDYLKTRKFLSFLLVINFIALMFFASNIDSPQNALKYILRDSWFVNLAINKIIFYHHLNIIIDMLLPGLLISFLILVTNLIIGFDNRSANRSLKVTAKIAYLVVAFYSLLFLLSFPWKYISPILTIFVAVLLPIAFMNKESPKASTNTSSTASKRTDELANNNVSNMEFKNTTKETKKKNSMDSNTQKGKKWVSNVSKVSFVVFTFSLSASIITPIWGHSINNFNELISLLSISAMVFSFISFVAAKIYSTL